MQRNMIEILSCLLVVGILMSASSTIVAAKENWIINGYFSDGLNNWTERGYGIGNRQVEVVYDDAINSSVLEFKRWNSGADGGMEGVYQNLSINVSEYKSLYLETDIKVISNSLDDSGWWSDVYGGDGEFPVHIFLYYKDENGTDRLWTHGFLPVKDRLNRRNCDIVNRSEWYHYVSTNLVNVSTTTTQSHNVPIYSPPPKTITGIFLGGKGWDFRGRIDNAKLYGEKGAPTPSIIYVPDDYAKIQWAVDNATAGSTIIVRDGTYSENVNMNKRLTIRSENGSANCIIQAKNPGDHVFEVTADYVNISGFTVIDGAPGISIIDCGNSLIINNKILNNTQVGIYLSYSNGNLFQNNIIRYSHAGISLKMSNRNRIINNILSDTSIYGAICLGHQNTNNIIEGNEIFGNERGMWFVKDFLGYPRDNVVRNNSIFNNVYGFYFDDAVNNTIYLNNFINNDDNVYSSYDSINIWNSTEKIIYTYNGSTYMNYTGNYWADYNGIDANGNGIGDTPYSIDSDKDKYPLVETWENYFARQERRGDLNDDGEVVHQPMQLSHYRWQ